MKHRDLGRPTAERARKQGAEAYQNAQSQQANPYRSGTYGSRVAKWWLEGWMKEARKEPRP